MRTRSPDSTSQPARAGPTKSLLRLLACGSVDDGKSTLLGRLMFDAGLVPEDQWASVLRLSAARNPGSAHPDFSLLLDSLLDERAQGITIDVAWRYFQTQKRKFIVADAPGHEQYTRNMATGASQCDFAMVLVDACQGVTRQTRRHTAIVRFMGIEQVLVAVNKMDLAGWDERVFEKLKKDFLDFAGPLGVTGPVFIPVCAVQGDNIVHRSRNMAWYSGPPMLDFFEKVETKAGAVEAPMRFPVQWVARTGGFRGYCGTVAAGTVRTGDAVTVLPARVGGAGLPRS